MNLKLNLVPSSAQKFPLQRVVLSLRPDLQPWYTFALEPGRLCGRTPSVVCLNLSLKQESIVISSLKVPPEVGERSRTVAVCITKLARCTSLMLLPEPFINTPMLFIWADSVLCKPPI